MRAAKLKGGCWWKVKEKDVVMLGDAPSLFNPWCCGGSALVSRNLPEPIYGSLPWLFTCHVGEGHISSSRADNSRSVRCVRPS